MRVKSTVLLFIMPRPTQCRVLVCSDGAPSKLAQQLGLVKQPPQTSCSRCYIEGGTHKFKADGVLFYNKELLPGTVRTVNIREH